MYSYLDLSTGIQAARSGHPGDHSRCNWDTLGIFVSLDMYEEVDCVRYFRGRTSMATYKMTRYQIC